MTRRLILALSTLALLGGCASTDKLMLGEARAPIDLIATAFSAPDTGGTGEHEPMLFAIPFGKGRVFHTTLGHDVNAMRCVGFIATLQRGAEWAATGKVTVAVPKDFPDKTTVRIR